MVRSVQSKQLEGFSVSVRGCLENFESHHRNPVRKPYQRQCSSPGIHISCTALDVCERDTSTWTHRQWLRGFPWPGRIPRFSLVLDGLGRRFPVPIGWSRTGWDPIQGWWTAMGRGEGIKTQLTCREILLIYYLHSKCISTGCMILKRLISGR